MEDAIEDILLHDWDPVGICDNTVPRGEYSCYVAGVYRLLAAGASVDEITEHLGRIEQRRIGFTSPVEKRRHAAGRLHALRLRSPNPRPAG
ncbi:MAG TPA: hypothetical protein VGA37_08750 [Gemmatimonadales bacterium]